MEILSRAKNKTDGEVVSCFESESNIKEEVDRRIKKAGYMQHREGISSGWTKQYGQNYDRIFRKEI